MKSLPVTLAVGGSGEVGGSTRLLMNVHHGNHIGLGRQERAQGAGLDARSLPSPAGSA